MLKTIYHGSDKIIEKPLFGYGKPYNDYGLGFYCTEVLDLAKEWGASKNNDGFANIYQIETDRLSTFDLNSSEHTILHWLAVLLENRMFDISNALAQEAKDYLLKNFNVPYNEFDIITGYRADDSYFSFAQDFINGAISVRSARRQYFDVERNRRQRGDLYIVQILDEEIKADDPRLR